jgi:hypothetical protein
MCRFRIVPLRPIPSSIQRKKPIPVYPESYHRPVGTRAEMDPVDANKWTSYALAEQKKAAERPYTTLLEGNCCEYQITYFERVVAN